MISQRTLDLQSGKKTRAQHLAMLRALSKSQGISTATVYWLQECPRISRSAFNAAVQH